jgi:hypothetical protein
MLRQLMAEPRIDEVYHLAGRPSDLHESRCKRQTNIQLWDQFTGKPMLARNCVNRPELVWPVAAFMVILVLLMIPAGLKDPL